MSESPSSVQITADGLTVLRADAAMMELVGASDPFAHWFITDEGHQLVALALEIDPIYALFNLARYRWFGERMQSAAEQFSQVVVLGAGYDTRPIWMGSFKGGKCRVFEVDLGTTLLAKRRVLEAHGVKLPTWVVPVSCDLNINDLVGVLKEAGFRPEQPSFIMAEGLVYFLEPRTVSGFLSPAGLDLAPGSAFHFDFWTEQRTNRLNDRLFERRGIHLFRKFPLLHEADTLEAALSRRGFNHIKTTDLESVARGYWPPPHNWSGGDGWLLVEMTAMA
jgi:methyltransferase (TIGR00027 family)